MFSEIKYFPVWEQFGDTCAIECTGFVLSHYGLKGIGYDVEVEIFMRNRMDENGKLSMMDISECLELHGLTTLGVRQIHEVFMLESNYFPVPFILHIMNNHFVVVYGVNSERDEILIGDPATGKLRIYPMKKYLQLYCCEKVTFLLIEKIKLCTN